MDLFTYLMAKKGQNTGRDLFSYLLGKGGGESGTYTTFSGTSLNILNTVKGKIKNIILKSTPSSQTGTPTPSNPLPIESVQGLQNIKIEDKNLFSDIIIGQTFRNQSDRNRALIYGKILPNTSYTISFGDNTGIDGLHYFEKANKEDDTITYGTKLITTTTTRTTQNNSNWIGIQINKTNVTLEDVKNIKLQLEKGTTASSYVEHKEQNYAINLKEIETYNKNDVTTLNCSISTSAIGPEASTPNTYMTIYMECNPNQTYTISKKMDETRNRFIVAYSKELPAAGVSVYGAISNNNVSTISINTGGEAKYLVAYVWITGSTTSYQEMLDSIQIETTEHLKLATEEYLFKNEQGSPLYNNQLVENNWYKRKVYNETIYDGTENWKFGTGNVFYVDNITNYAISNNIPMSNYFKGISNVTGAGDNAFTTNDNVIAFINISGATTPGFYICSSYFNSNVNELKTWLTTHNVSVLYKLETIQYINITENCPALAQQLENMYNNAKSYNDETNVTQTNTDLPFEISFDVLVKGE